MSCCFDPHLLQDHLDDRLLPAKRREVDEHLIDCTRCRDALRALSRVERFLSGPRATVGAFDRDLLEDELSGVRQRSLRRVRQRLVAVAAVLLLALVGFALNATDGESSLGGTPAPRAAENDFHPDALSAVLAALDPDLDVTSGDPAYRELLLELLGSDDRERARSGGPAWRSIGRSLAEVVGDLSRPLPDRLRAGRAGAVLAMRRVLPPLERLLQGEELPPHWQRHALFSIAAFHGEEAARVLERVSHRRSCSRKDLAEALIRTAHPKVAAAVQELLEAEGVALDDLVVALSRIPGADAGRRIGELYLSGLSSAALERILLERPAAVTELRRRAPQLEGELRVRALRLLGLSGDQAVLPLLRRLLLEPEIELQARLALRDLAFAGVRPAAEILVEGVPVSGLSEQKVPAAELQRLRRIFERAPLSFERLLEAGAESARGRLTKARWLSALALVGSERSGAFLVELLDRSPEHAAATLDAIALHGHPGRIAPILPFAGAATTRVRRAGLRALIRCGDAQVADVLVSAVRRARDRRFLVRQIAREDVPPWCRPVLEEATRFLDSAGEARELLRTLEERSR